MAYSMFGSGPLEEMEKMSERHLQHPVTMGCCESWNGWMAPHSLNRGIRKGSLKKALLP